MPQPGANFGDDPFGQRGFIPGDFRPNKVIMNEHWMAGWLNRCHFGDCLETLRRMPDGLVQTCVTSPPYFGLRDYGHAGQIGLEPTPDEFVAKLVTVFREVRRVLRDDGTLWLNIGDSYNAKPGQRKDTDEAGEKQQSMRGSTAAPSRSWEGCKPKDLIGIPWMLAFALRADGWYLRQEIIWAKPNPMPESVTDRCTKSHEQIFLLAKSSSYFCDMASIKEPVKQDWGTRDRDGGKYHQEGTGLQPHSGLEKTYTHANKRSVWTVSTKPYKGAHFATFPPDLIEPCVLAGAPAGGIVLDPFFGSGTTGQVAQALGRQFIGIELNEAYKPLQDERLRQPSLILEAA